MLAIFVEACMWCVNIKYRGDSRFATSQWEMALLCNDVFHWLGASLESALEYHWVLKQVQISEKHHIFRIQMYCVIWCINKWISIDIWKQL